MVVEGLTFVEPGRVEWRSQTLPPLLDGEVRVRTLYSGISSGTELLAFRGEIDPALSLDDEIASLAGNFTYPFLYGYSCVGIVEQGSSLSRDTIVFAFHPHQTYFNAPADTLIRVTSEARRATMLPLVETALQVSLDAGPLLEAKIAVMGAGMIGMLTCILLIRGGANVTIVEPDPWRRETAEKLGIVAIHPSKLSSLFSLDTVIDTSGNPDVPGHSLQLLRPEGTLLVASWFGNKQVLLPLGAEFHRRRLVIKSTQVSTIPSIMRASWSKESRRQRAAQLIDRLPLDVLSTHVFPRGSAQEAFERLDEGSSGMLHVALDYGG